MNDTDKIAQIQLGLDTQRDLLEETRTRLATVAENAHLLPKELRHELHTQQDRNAWQLAELDLDYQRFTAWKDSR